ncbi:uncharacterized protein LOC130988112 [Salvia miltiorrhiza]|uniref:uncharacterized protein LOC130988112 n=1 Tax=Salvia miltiorrhiza TaxID=226208 RepID=UPI0025ACD0BE|nr:uncharacterized protein LOC130988112 [Salvia miltiorrhiza]XP_057767856.1 uncharacterized protein LOC130988112 [Salvia miltiorrhiza]
MKEKSWACTLITQLSLCVVAYVAINIEKFTPRSISNQGNRQNDVYFMSVAGGFRPVEEQTLLLQQMVKVQKTYKVLFVVEFSELGESDPLLQNATLYPALQNIPWYNSGALTGEGKTYFSKKIEVPHGQTIDIIALDTVLLKDQSTALGNDQIAWLTKTLNESNSDWKIVVGLHQLISSDFNILKVKETRFEPVWNILLQYGVDVYMSSKTCEDNTKDKAIYLTAMNHNVVSKEATGGGFLLHRVSSLEMLMFMVKLSGEVEHRFSFQQRGRAAI